MVGEGKVAVTQPVSFSAIKRLDIGRELGTLVTPGVEAEATIFSGAIKWVELSVGDDDHSHMIAPEDYLTLLMSKQ